MNRGVRSAFASFFVVLAITIHLAIRMTETEYPAWWGVLNFVPSLLGFAVDLAGHQDAEIGLYIGLIIQWALLGYLAEHFYTKYVKPKPR